MSQPRKSMERCNQQCNLKVTFTFLGVRENVREWTHTLPNELPFWKLKWTPKFSKNLLGNQNSLDWGLHYTIGNLLRLRCFKWSRMMHLNTYNTSYDWKKGWESKCQFNSWSLNVENHHDLFVWRRFVTCCWKVFNKGYDFVMDLTSIRCLHKKLWVSKVARS
jgi:hypothetical protein